MGRKRYKNKNKKKNKHMQKFMTDLDVLVALKKSPLGFIAETKWRKVFVKKLVFPGTVKVFTTFCNVETMDTSDLKLIEPEGEK